MKRNVLYVDDEPENLIVFEAGFESEFTVHCVGSGPEALAVLEKAHIPVVVADQRMPGMSGAELFEIMRDKHPHTKRIILTGYSDSAAMLDAINKGQVYHFVTKPWERNALLSILLRAIEAHDLEVENTALTDRLVATERCATLGQMAARIAHEMGNQLCMLPLLEYIEDEFGDHEELVKLADLARQTHDHLAALIDEVKRFIRFGQGSCERRPVRLGAALHELVAFLRFDKSIPHKQLRVQLKETPPVSANKVNIQQVVVNLVKNAAHAIGENPEGLIRLGLQREGSDAVIRVADNGCGISRETLQRIWEPFFTTKGDGGSGLGLDVSRRLIEDHGGTIACQSELGRGTTFTIRLPLWDTAARPRAEHESTSPRLAEPAVEGQCASEPVLERAS